ncbi:MAG: hypothetical protein IPK52_20535 [Chloroflexi bacterium]|nr:hypothetical protein [Chloroflexota bacterium]
MAREGYLVGISAAAAMAGALRVPSGWPTKGNPAWSSPCPDNAWQTPSESFWARAEDEGSVADTSEPVELACSARGRVRAFRFR